MVVAVIATAAAIPTAVATNGVPSGLDTQGRHCEDR
jgi:hypothetical protein